MTIIELREYCLSLPATSYDFPFDAETIVFRVAGRIFALAGVNDEPLAVNLKCDPVLARDLRGAFTAVMPGYHMNKEHWNTVITGGDVTDEKVRWMIDHSYERVVERLAKKRRPGPR